MKTRLIFLVSVMLTISVLCNSQSAKALMEDPQVFEDLKIKVDSLIKKYQIPGAGIALISKDSIIYCGGVGYADMKNKIPVTENTLFRVGSITKTFLALGFLKLIEENKIDLQTPVKEIAPEIKIDNPWQNTDPVRIVHLLEHTAGFDDIHLNSIFNKDTEMSLKQALDEKANLRKVRWKPGTRYSYSSAGYTLAGYILEKITQQRYEDYLKESILEPIGMKISTFRLNDESKQLLALGYNNNEPLPYFDGYDRPASSLISSVKEMATFIQFMINRGMVGEKQIIKNELIDQVGISTTTIASEAGLKDGYGFGVGVQFRHGFKWYNHIGGGPGCIAKFSYIKKEGLGYVVMANSMNSEEFDKIVSLVQSYLIRGINPPLKHSVQIPGNQLEKYCGYYELRNSRSQLFRFLDIMIGGTTITFKNDTLYQQDFMNNKQVLIPVSSNMFRRSSEPEASRIFVIKPDNLIFASIIGSYYEKTGSWKPIIYRIFVFGAFIIMFSGIIYAFYWVPVLLYKKIIRKEYVSKYTRIKALPLFSILSLMIGILAVSNQTLVEAGFMTINNIIFFISTIVFAGLSTLSLIFSVISFKKPVKMINRVYAVLISSACFGMTLYLGYWGIIGLRLWAY